MCTTSDKSTVVLLHCQQKNQVIAFTLTRSLTCVRSLFCLLCSLPQACGRGGNQIAIYDLIHDKKNSAAIVSAPRISKVSWHQQHGSDSGSYFSVAQNMNVIATSYSRRHIGHQTEFTLGSVSNLDLVPAILQMCSCQCHTPEPESQI